MSCGAIKLNLYPSKSLMQIPGYMNRTGLMGSLEPLEGPRLVFTSYTVSITSMDSPRCPSPPWTSSRQGSEKVKLSGKIFFKINTVHESA